MLRDIGTRTIETERLILRRFELTDAEAMYENWCQYEDVTKYLSWIPHQNIEETKTLLRDWINSYKKAHTYHYLIVHKKNQVAIGSMGCVSFSVRNESCEVGYCLARAYWNQGLATEVLKALLTELFENVGVHRVYARFVVANPGSGKVMEKAGMVYEGIQKEAHKLHNGAFSDLGVYSLLKQQYYNKYKGDYNGSNN